MMYSDLSVIRLFRSITIRGNEISEWSKFNRRYPELSVPNRGAQSFCIIRGYIYSIRKNGQLVIDAIRSAWSSQIVRPNIPLGAEQLHFDALDRLGSITAETLVLSGEQDRMTPPWICREVAKAIPNARFELVSGDGSSHVLPLERPDEFNAKVMSFLQR